MTIEIKSPTFPESVADGTVANWVKKEGESVNQDEIIAEIETDKVVLEVVAPSNGVLTKIIKNEGDIVNSAEVIGEFDEKAEAIKHEKSLEDVNEEKDSNTKEDQLKIEKNKNSGKSGPAAKKLIVENNLDSSLIKPSGKDKRITKADVNKAYIKIQKKIHPDISPETSRLSSIVNEAKDIVLNDIS